MNKERLNIYRYLSNWGWGHFLWTWCREIGYCFFDAERLKMDDAKYRQQHQLLREFLAGADLQGYLDVLIHRLKVHSTAQLKYVKDDDLLEVGMSKPEVQRLMKLYRKQTAQPGTFSKLKKVCFLSSLCGTNTVKW